MSRYILSTLLLFIVAVTAFSQNDHTLYYMNRIPQSVYSNPALLPETKYNVGVPLVSSVYGSFGNSGFTYNNLLRDSISTTIRRLSPINDVTMNLAIELLHVGFTIDKHYFTLTSSERVNFRFSYPKDFFLLVWEGNGGSELHGRRANMDGFGIDFTRYREYTLGWAAPITDNITVGARIKRLSGFQNMWTKKSELGLSTDEVDNELVLSGGMEINTSGVNSVLLGDVDTRAMLVKAGNNGLAMDLGIDFKYSDQLTFSGALIDFGYINWKNDIKNYKQEDFELRFTGLDLNEVVSQEDFTGRNTLQALKDSIENTFVLQESEETYRTWLNSRIVVGIEYSFSDAHRAGFLLQNQFAKGRLRPAATLSMNSRIGKLLSTSASFSYYNRSFYNVGFGLVANLWPVQFYVVTDNILVALTPQNVKNAHIRMGMNITLRSQY